MVIRNGRVLENIPFDDQTQLRIYLESQAKLFIQQQVVSKEYKLVM